jgi:hypothetical protein
MLHRFYARSAKTYRHEKLNDEKAVVTSEFTGQVLRIRVRTNRQGSISTIGSESSVQKAPVVYVSHHDVRNYKKVNVPLEEKALSF